LLAQLTGRRTKAHAESAGDEDPAITTNRFERVPASERLISVRHFSATGEPKTSWIAESELVEFFRSTLNF